MSLINQALRKVQSERTAKSSTLGGSNPGTSYPYHQNRNNKTGLIIGLSVGVFVLISLVAYLTVVLLLKDPNPAVADENNPEIHVQKTNLDVAVDPPVSNKEQLSTAQSTNEIRIPATKPNQEIEEWLSQSKVFGIRISKNSSKVILNNKAFTTGEIVNSDFGLKLLNIEEKKLLFVDSNGVEYSKRL